MATEPDPVAVRRIAAVRRPWCVTIYSAAEAWQHGNHPTEAAVIQISAVLDQLRIAGAPDTVSAEIRANLEALAAPVTRDGNTQGRSVGVFADEDGAEMFALATSPAPWTGVADRYLIAPLLAAALALTPPIFVLAASENDVRVIDVTTRPSTLVAIPHLPSDLRSTVRLDLTGDRESLAHLRTSEDPKVRLEEYSRAIDRVLTPVLTRAGAVLVIAAAEPLASIYRATSDHAPIASSVIAGNHDHASVDDIARRATGVVDDYRRGLIEAELARFAELPTRGLVLIELEEVARAAREGAVDTLFVDIDRRLPVPGQAFDGITTIDRVDEIVRDALANRSNVVPVRADDLTSDDPVAAVLRYARRNPVDASSVSRAARRRR